MKLCLCQREITKGSWTDRVSKEQLFSGIAFVLIIKPER